MNSYRSAAEKIVKGRHAKNAPRASSTDLTKIKSNFISFILKGNFKNVIDLIVEWYDINTDDLDFELLLQEILCLEGVIITDQVNLSITKSPTVTFKNVFGMDITFTDSQNTGHTFHLTISRFLKAPIYSGGVDPSRKSLEELVADYFESKG